MSKMHSFRQLCTLNWTGINILMFWKNMIWKEYGLNPTFKFKERCRSNIAKGTTDPRVEFILQDHSSQFTNLEHITISESRLSINFKISTTNISISTKSKVKILTKTSFRILTDFVTLIKHQQQNTDQTSASKSRLNFNFKLLTKPMLKVWTKV